MKKKIKLYLHHSQFEPVSYKQRTGFFGYVQKILVGLLNAVLIICYGVGMTVLQIILLPVTTYKFFKSAPKNIRSALGNLRTEQFRRNIIRFALCVAIVSVAVRGLALIAVGQNIKGQVLGASDAGIGYLEDAKNSLQSQNTAAAQANFQKALEQFQNSEQTLNSTSADLKGLLAVVPQKQDADKLLEAAQKITEAALKATQLLDLTDKMKLSAVGLNNGDQNHGTLLQAQSLLNDSVDLANQAAGLINEVNISSIPENYRPTFVAAKDTASFFQSNVTALKEICSLVFDIVLGQKNILIVFENNNELRPSGGFMGTVGNAKLSDGSLTALDIRSVYDWDGQLKAKILPPPPLLAVNNQWFLRDSNWFGNFSTSAGRIGAFFEKEGGETPDLVIAMTPDVILDMLDRTGPIYLPQHNVTLDKNNFVEQTQAATSVNYDKTLNQPKQFLADFFPLLMDKLGSSNKGLINFLEVFQKNLYNKQVVLYSRDPALEKKITDFNWGGNLRETDRDYLSIVNANLGGTKTDRAIMRSVEMHSTVDNDGQITDTIKYTVKNPLPKTDGLNNKSFIRFFVPKGSQLKSADGFNRDIQIPNINPEGYVLDETVSQWQQGIQQDTASGTYYGTEAGNTWFGNWLNVAGGETKTVTLSYVLPFKLGKIDRYSLLLQKQPGSMTDDFSFDLDFSGRSSLWNSSNSSVSNHSWQFHQSLNADMFIGIVLAKN